jgi:8-oxo-dGTP diphosphatase
MNSPFSHKLRVRVNGILIETGCILLAELQSPTRPDPFWTPPGGGVDFGETMTQALVREFAEETGLQIAVDGLLFVSEYVKHPWHAVELYFRVHRESGALRTGRDPELEGGEQMIRDVRFIPLLELDRITLVPDFLSEKLRSQNGYLTDTPEWIH